MITKTLSVISWNVRGLGQSSRCDDVLCELISQRPDVVALQETKLMEVTSSKSKTFLPSRLASFATHPADGSAGGILTAWDADVLKLMVVLERDYTVTTSFLLNADGSPLSVTNVYAPSDHRRKSAFLAELSSIATSLDGPWMIIGDFNMTRVPTVKNNHNFNFVEAGMFNDMISAAGLMEIPLVDRAFTWSNKRDIPTLARLDAALSTLLGTRPSPTLASPP